VRRCEADNRGRSGVDAEGLTITLQKSNRGRTQLMGVVNGGGSRPKLRSSGGKIVIGRARNDRG